MGNNIERPLIVECKNEKCFKDLSKRLHCENCEEGKLICVCFNCGKRNEVKHMWARIDCECGASTIPCESNSRKLERK